MNKKIRTVLLKLIHACREKTAYSVMETAKKIGIDYQQIQALTLIYKQAREALDFCRGACACNAEIAGITFKLPTDEAFKYMCESDDEFKERYEKEQAIELRAKLEKEGKEIPPTQCTRITMSSITEVKTKQLVNAVDKKKIQKQLPAPKRTLTDRESERLDAWKKKTTIVAASLKFSLNDTGENEAASKDTFLSVEPIDPTKRQSDLLNSTLYAATGSANQEYALSLIMGSIGCIVNNAEEGGRSATMITEVLLSLKPQDEIEGMLCSRLLILHNQSMTFMSRVSNPNQTQAGIDLNLNRSMKLTRLYNEALETLNRYRRKGEQKVTVQHVNVRDGGQAIVNGQVNRGEGVSGKK